MDESLGALSFHLLCSLGGHIEIEPVRDITVR